ncbi:energy-coupled thiamine transporter ThiT [Acidaminobacter sp. JC074]|uniref:energy-coupled thiamine transporter ThiT n=1 Tax=Acidaminobacter sp. JC074 TaxID=2530199 RepID=UPI001F0F9555|nr:energy-coupled thiamine transporter ThiT [Acidaminobacter sp. JC074]MCH4889852.1 energy-coupled thiamine transporter ThiT [Acidaminobacter sp. JC074]
MEVILATILTVAVFAFAIVKLTKFKWNTKSIARIGIVSALTIVLYSIKLVPFPQGGGCSLLSVLPIMILAVLYGMEEAFICGIIVGITKIIIAPPYFPMQIPLDYLGAMIALGLTPIFGTKNPIRLLGGALFATSISTFFSILSGIIFFGQFAPEGMSTWAYATIYNIAGYGVEVGLSIVILLIISPRLKRFEVRT